MRIAAIDRRTRTAAGDELIDQHFGAGAMRWRGRLTSPAGTAWARWPLFSPRTRRFARHLAAQRAVVVQTFQPSSRPCTRWRSMSRTTCSISNGLRESAMQRVPAWSSSSLRSTAVSNMTPPSLVTLLPSNQPSTTRQPRRLNLIVTTSTTSVQLASAFPARPSRFDTSSNATPRAMPSSLLRGCLKYPARPCSWDKSARSGARATRSGSPPAAGNDECATPDAV